MFCRHCGYPLPYDVEVCPQCGTLRGNGNNFCPNCAGPVQNGTAFCGHCGCPLGGNPPPPPHSGQGYSYQSPNQGHPYGPNAGGNPNNVYPFPTQKSRLAAGILGIILGSLGIHNFYLGFTSKAVVQLLLTLVGGILTCGLSSAAVSIWGLVEGILILTGSISRDASGLPLKD